MQILGVIPARGGSKGIPGKNMVELAGQPLIVHTIQTARSAQGISQVVVSTDDAQIARVALEAGAEVPFIRPASLATDTASSIPVIQHALNEVEQISDFRFDAVMMLQPTCPLRNATDIEAAIALFASRSPDSVISVVDVGATHPARMKFVSESGELLDPTFAEARENQNRQELPDMVIRNGAIYLTRRETLLAGSFRGDRCIAYRMPRERSANIDSPLDLEWAEFLLTRRKATADDR